MIIDQQTLSLGSGVTIPFQSEESKTIEIERLKEENKKLKEELEKFNNICYKCKTPFSEEDKLFYKLNGYKSLPQIVGFRCGKCDHIKLNENLTNDNHNFIMFAEWNKPRKGELFNEKGR